MKSGRELVAAVGRGDAEDVTVLLEAGADPDTVTDDGLPVLCLAVGAHDAAVASALVGRGADPDRRLPDGTTPLLRAVDGGSWAMTKALLGNDPLRLPEAERERLIALARHWYERGADVELRNRTGESGPVHEEQGEDGEYDQYEDVARLTLGGFTVRAGHGAILTQLESVFGIVTPVDELVDRALAQGAWPHADWRSAESVLAFRRDPETFPAVTAHRHDPDPGRRLFVLSVFRSYRMQVYLDIWSRQGVPFGKETADVLVAWAMDGEEEDPHVLARVLSTLKQLRHPEMEAVGLRHAGHPSPAVRAEVPDLVFDWATWRTPLGAAREALLLLAADVDPGVRRRAGDALSVADDGSGDIISAIVGLLRDPEFEVRKDTARHIEAVGGEIVRVPAVAEALRAVRDEDASAGT
ncbi:ankyrin repeat domain-containing protein [Streptomyces sp. NPDC006544]|uniref:ankyrin repeat domain-containing protein n=1 Tax=Streptomyces sp. NPDC006544 TaxID=3154583 RepID=UPI00339E845B